MPVSPSSSRSLNLRVQPALPEGHGETPDHHQSGKIPQGVVAETSTGAENDEDARDLILNGFFCQLYRRDGDDADGSGIQTREKSVHGER